MSHKFGVKNQIEEGEKSVKIRRKEKLKFLYSQEANKVGLRLAFFGDHDVEISLVELHGIVIPCTI